MEGDDDDDPVVETFDVFLQREPDEETFLLQHFLVPLQNDPPTYEKTEFRPENSMLRASYRVNTGGHFELDQSSADYEQELKKRESQVLVSDRVRKRETAYAAGFVELDEKRIHLIPLTNIFAMKPMLSSDIKGNEIIENIVEAAAPEAPQTLEVKNLRRDTIKAQGYLRQTYSMYADKLESEPWTPLDISDRMSSKAALEYENVINSTNSWEVQQGFSDVEEADDEEVTVTNVVRPTKGYFEPLEAFTASSKKYLDVIAPMTTSRLNVPEKDMTQVTPAERLRLTLSRVIVGRFDDILQNSASSASKHMKSNILLIQQGALMVRGNWVLPSKDYFADRFGEVEGNSLTMDRRRALRDVILAEISKAEVNKSELGAVDPKYIKKICKVPTTELREAHQGICTVDKESKFLKFVRKDDLRFIKQHSSLHLEWQERWKVIEKEALMSLGVPAATATDIANATPAKLKTEQRVQPKSEDVPVAL